MLTPAAVLLTPWAVHEHGALTPEVAALPLMMGAALSSVERRHAWLAGALCGLLPLFKFPFAIPAVVIVALSADLRRTALWAVGTLVLGLALTTVFAGESFWRETVYAQTQTGSRSLGLLKGFWAQAGWNQIGLLFCAALAVRYRRLASDWRVLRTAIGLGVAMVVTFLTNFKVGTGLNIAVPVEATLVPLAATGTVFAWRTSSSLWLPLGCAAAILFTLAQSVSLIASPRHSEPVLRAGSRPAWGEQFSGSQLRAAATVASHCPAGVPYGGPPLIAFVADRPMPGDQADQFIIAHARTLAFVAARVAAVKRLCP